MNLRISGRRPGRPAQPVDPRGATPPDNNDDTICLKAGRDADGLRVDRPTEYVFIRDNLSRRGGGVISFGSETSGGIRHVVAYRNRGVGTNDGVRFKSAKTRGGFVEDVLIRDLTMMDVPLPMRGRRQHGRCV